MIGANIRKIRKSKHMTMRKLSRRTGISYSHITSIELYNGTASVAILSKIADALDVPIKKFFA